ncbi:MAG: 2-C-methyl-D-erythritol 4-phosphate cytidylyltransferase [Acidimicrobiales bacterium]
MTSPRSKTVDQVVTTIVFAAGSGQRFGSAKQFAVLGHERLVDRVVRIAGLSSDHIVLVLPTGHRWTGRPVTATVSGGDSHGASVRAGIAVVPTNTDIVVLATSSHPLASSSLFRAVIDAVLNGADAATPKGDLGDALKTHEGERISGTVDKSDLAVAQSPSAFRFEILKRALVERPEAPEELQLVEEMSGNVVFVPGEETNIHITTPVELEMARLIKDLVAD